jgi:HD-GYP domain-containing protein (c-di-GMP phosphodiesterase class II)
MVNQMANDLVPISIDLLYDNVVLPHDAYDADAKILLIRSGHVLRMAQIEAIQRINLGRNTILVTKETHQLLMKRTAPPAKSPDEAASAKNQLEDETGYTDLKNNSLRLINEIVNTEQAPREQIHTLSLDLAEKLDKVPPDVVLDIINTLAPIDEYLQRHCVNVSLLNGLIGKWLELPKETVEMLVLVGLVHDCGKAAVPQEVLNAPRKLTEAEFEVMKMHPVYGYDILADFPEAVRCGVRGHHEKYSGKGYPDDLRGTGIPLAAQITAVSDIYDAMVSRRVYKDSRNPFSIIAWLRNLRVTDLDNAIVELFIKRMPGEMVNKPIQLSDGRMGVIHKIDYGEIEHPYIRIGDRIIKSSNDLFCAQIMLEDTG